jgi:hypothetical protein
LKHFREDFQAPPRLTAGRLGSAGSKETVNVRH